MDVQPIAEIRNAFDSKFAVPRQSGLVESVVSEIVFRPEYRVRDALRGLEGYDYLWLVWVFSENKKQAWEPTVRPPRLGGNRRMGVFATRSPQRPNPIGLSSVRLLGIRDTSEGPVLQVSGADMVSGTPILDIKPYLPYTDAHPGARAGFTDTVAFEEIQVEIPEELLLKLPEAVRPGLAEVLRQDPRPGYQRTAGRMYGFPYAGYEVKFVAEESCLRVVSIEKETGA